MAWTTPRTYVTGEVITAAILNTDVRDNLAFLRKFPFLQNAACTGVTSAGTEGIIGTVTVVDPGVPYYITPSAYCTGDAAAGTAFAMRIRADNASGTVLGIVVGVHTTTQAIAYAIPSASPIGVASGAKTIVATMQRLSGATNMASNSGGRLTCLMTAQ